MESLYVIEPGAYLRRESQALKVVKGDQVIDKIPAAGLKKLILAGYTSLSGAVLDFLISRRIETVFITPTGRYRGRLMVDEHRHVALRKAQYIQLGDAAYALEVARCMVRGKVENMSRMLISRASLYNDAGIRRAAAQMQGVRNYLVYADNPDKLRGYVDEQEMKAARPVEMKPAVMRAFIAAYEQMMTRRVNVRVGDNRSSTYRNLLLNQARQFQNMLLANSNQYQSFIGKY